jgi:hypothetical protein
LLALLLYLYRRGNASIGRDSPFRSLRTAHARAAAPAHSPPYA